MSSVFHFPGGIHPKEGHGGKAATSSCAIQVAPAPSRVAIPLQQHIGAPCKPLVQKGDHVKVGQMIGEPAGFLCAAIHSSVSGTVVSLEPGILANGSQAMCVVIDNDFNDEWVELKPVSEPDNLTGEELCNIARNMGIVGMGGATFPTCVKLNIAPGKQVDTLVLNGAECEPYLTADHRLMVEYAQDITSGAEIIRKALNIPYVKIGIEDNKPDAIAAMRDAATRFHDMEVVSVKARYPQGGEKQLVYALTHRVVKMGGLPLDVGCVVCNVGTCNAVYNAVYKGIPVIERVVTVGGWVNEPANYMARVGTPVEWLIDSSKGLMPETRLLIYGGPMMGSAISRQDIPVTKGCSGILALEKTDAVAEETACIRCGRCVNACPMRLSPATLDRYIRKDMFEEAEKANLMNCMECGACAFSCPAHRKLTQSFRTGKRVINQRRKKNAAKKGA